MRNTVLPAWVSLAAGVCLCAAAAATIPPADGEQSRYSINWPSGLSLGEAQLSAEREKGAAGGEDKLDFQFQIDASVPAFAVSDHYHAKASSGFCSSELDRNFQHGSKKTDEKTVFHNNTAKRETKGGGHTDIDTHSCAKDALTYLFYLRKELSEGRLPPQETVYFGAPYRLSVEFGGTQQITIGDKNVDADKLLATVKGDSSEVHFEMYFLKNAARTLALVKVPFTLGTFSMVLEK